MNPCLKQLVSSFQKQTIDAYLVTKDVNIRYLTDFPASESWLFVTPKKTFYITDFRYISEAQQGLKGISVKRYHKIMDETVFEIADTLKIKAIGFDDRHISFAAFKQLAHHCPKTVTLKPVNNLVEYLREIKSPAEVDMMRQALSLHQEALNFIKPSIKPGVTEKEILSKLETFVKFKDVTFSFPPIIASGPNAAYPHAKPTTRKIRRDEPVLLDMGIDINGYKSDLTRMFFLGRIPRFVSQINDLVKEAQQRAIQKITAGIPAKEVDFEARNFLKKNRLDKFFGHGLGHGVGLEIHEAPRLSPHSNAILKAGMIVTVEPAVYLPGKFGIRLEEMVLVTQKGCEVLSDDIH